MLVVALPLLVGPLAVDLLVPLAAARVLVWAVGLFFETVGDWQLARFEADPANRGQVLDRGLWAWTRRVRRARPPHQRVRTASATALRVTPTGGFSAVRGMPTWLHRR